MHRAKTAKAEQIAALATEALEVAEASKANAEGEDCLCPIRDADDLASAGHKNAANPFFLTAVDYTHPGSARHRA